MKQLTVLDKYTLPCRNNAMRSSGAGYVSGNSFMKLKICAYNGATMQVPSWMRLRESSG